jgi:hypothetical protein
VQIGYTEVRSGDDEIEAVVFLHTEEKREKKHVQANIQPIGVKKEKKLKKNKKRKRKNCYLSISCIDSIYAYVMLILYWNNKEVIKRGYAKEEEEDKSDR